MPEAGAQYITQPHPLTAPQQGPQGFKVGYPHNNTAPPYPALQHSTGGGKIGL